MEEKQALLYKDKAGGGRTHYPKGDSPESSSESSDECWEGSQSTSRSSRSYSQTSFEWEAEVKENGQLFYIKSDMVDVAERIDSYERQKQDTECEEKEDKAGNVKGGRLANWIRRRDVKRLQLKQKEGSDETNQPERPPQETESEDHQKVIKEAIIKLDNLNEGSTLSEKLLGLTLGSVNENKIVVVGINPRGPVRNFRDLSVGDVLEGINKYKVTSKNIDRILGSLSLPTEVLLKIQKNEEKDENSKHQSNFVRGLLEKNEALEGVLLEHPVGVVVINMKSQTLNKDDVVYSYPEGCALSCCRGAFVTLFHLLAEINPNNACQSSSIVMKNQLTHVIYKSECNILLLIAIPALKCSIKESGYVVTDLVRNLLFNYQTLKCCFERSEKSELDHFFSLFFSRILTDGFSSDASQFVSLECVLSSALEKGTFRFEDIVPHAVWVPLPREIQIQIDDALNELEANDIEHEEEDILENQRLYHIVGSCFFHKGYLLLSHLPKEDLVDVYSFYRQNCLIQLFRNEPVKSLIIWREVFPHSVNRGVLQRKKGYPTPSGRWFLLIVGQGYDSLAVILEAGGCCAEVNERADVAAAYIEEARDTLRHMQKLGISSLASQWIESNSRFKTITPEEAFARKVCKKKENLLGFVKSFEGNSKTSSLNISPASSRSLEIIGRKSRTAQQDTPEDSVSQAASNFSEVSDENAPILGRRAERGKSSTDNPSESDNSDSDWDSSRDSNAKGSSSSSGVDNFYVGELGEVIPAKLTTGPDCSLFSYIHLDGNEGVLLNPPLNSSRCTPKMMEILENFRRCAQIIHSVFENNIKFKKNSQDNSKNFINKSLIAVKEHGVLFECLAPETEGQKKPSSFAYWIVGRLFFTPQPREVYVCYYDEAPQNMIEIAFRLGLSAAG